jgi:hypothetical protein
VHSYSCVQMSSFDVKFRVAVVRTVFGYSVDWPDHILLYKYYNNQMSVVYNDCIVEIQI